MSKILAAILLQLMCLNIAFGTTKLTEVIKFASEEKAKALLTQEDDFTQSWSAFDIDSRMHTPNSTKSELLSFIKTQVRAWTDTDIARLRAVATKIDQRIAQQEFNLELPEEIYLIKTTGIEEGGAAGYTRSTYIVLKEDFVEADEQELEKLMIHELFHVLSRNNPELREKLYAIIGFKLMNTVQYPTVIQPFRITNPDATQLDCFIELTVNSEPVHCMMILYSKENYSSGDFFKYLNVGFLKLSSGSIKKVDLNKHQEPIIYTYEQVEGFFNQVGKNTKYIIHPEEILAENFTLALLNNLDVSNPEIVKSIQHFLRTE